MTKDDITRPEPGSLPARISFIEQAGGSAGYYVRFKDVFEEEAAGGEPDRKYIPILQYESQQEALKAAIEYRDRRAEELGLPIKAKRGPQSPRSEQTREQMSDSHNRLGLRGLGLSLDNSAGTIYPQLTAVWTGEEGQKKVKRGMASRGIWGTVELLIGYLQAHIHTEKIEEEIARCGAEGTARCLVAIARDSDRGGVVAPEFSGRPQLKVGPPGDERRSKTRFRRQVLKQSVLKPLIQTDPSLALHRGEEKPSKVLQKTWFLQHRKRRQKDLLGACQKRGKDSRMKVPRLPRTIDEHMTIYSRKAPDHSLRFAEQSCEFF